METLTNFVKLRAVQKMLDEIKKDVKKLQKEIKGKKKDGATN